MTAPLPLTIIGAGSIGQRHIGVAQDSPAVDLVAIVEPDETRRGDLAQHGLPMVAHLEAVPPETRAAIIATPTPDHWQITMDCLDRGWAVLVEKPTAHTVDAAQSLVDAATARGLPFFTGHHRRCHPFTIAARDKERKRKNTGGEKEKTKKV